MIKINLLILYKIPIPQELTSQLFMKESLDITKLTNYEYLN
jgi:hypothetical protein